MTIALLMVCIILTSFMMTVSTLMYRTSVRLFHEYSEAKCIAEKLANEIEDINKKLNSPEFTAIAQTVKSFCPSSTEDYGDESDLASGVEGDDEDSVPISIKDIQVDDAKETATVDAAE